MPKSHDLPAFPGPLAARWASVQFIGLSLTACHLVLKPVKYSTITSFALACLTTACSDPFHTQFAAVQPAAEYRSQIVVSQLPPDRSLTVMTYNLKFGGGRIDFFFDCHGDRVLMTRREVLTNLAVLAEKIRAVDPDILFLQEVDVGSKRSAYVDQLQWLLDHSALNFGHYASHWKADFVPSDGLGAVDSGNAILSRFPLQSGTRIALALREDQSAIEQYFYLQRNLLRSEVVLPGGDQRLWLVGVHAAAYSQDGTKKKHIDRFKQELDDLSAQGTVIGAGDLNALPPDSEQVRDFDDSVCTEMFEADDYAEEAQWLLPLYADYSPAITQEQYAADNSRYFSHTTSKDGFWNRKLDYLFTNGAFEENSGITHQNEAQGGMNTMLRSDHAPLSATFDLRSLGQQ